MGEKVTLELSEELDRRIREAAARARRPVEEILVELLDRAGTEPAPELLSDEEVLALCDAQLEATLQEELSDLLEQNREGALAGAGQVRLDELMRIYRAGLVRKAHALKVAVDRGLKPRLG
jgi:hypothetical protein